ncbi:unnamed protein product [Rhizophagus irregularis]|nr:unnamed protein product [Rhizophagus irregularis]
MITSDATANAESEVNIPTAPIPSTHVSNNSSNNSSRNGPVAVSTSTMPQGEWGAGEYRGERTYRITCKDPLNHGTPIVSVKA